MPKHVLTSKAARAILKIELETCDTLKLHRPSPQKDSVIQSAEGNLAAMRGQRQQAIDRNSSIDIRLRQVEDTAPQDIDGVLEQLETANIRLWHAESNAESRLGQIERGAQAQVQEAATKLEATIQRQQMIGTSGRQLEETLQQETMQRKLLQPSGRELEETLQLAQAQAQLQQQHQDHRLHD